MKNFTIPFKAGDAIHVLLCLILFFPLHLLAQKTKNEPNAKGYGRASYHEVDKGKYMKTWWVAGPFKINEKSSGGQTMDEQEKFFKEDLISQVSVSSGAFPPPIKIDEKDFSWLNHTSTEDVIDFDVIFNKADYAAGYALAEFKADSSYLAFLAIGSDDGVKVWHNGKLIHTNWIGRAITPDEDVLPVTLVKGSNQLLLKVQDMAGEWGFTARFLDKAALSDVLIKASASGDLDEVNLLLSAGADLEKTNPSGLTALTAAALNGRDEVVNLMIQKGAKKKDLPAPQLFIQGLYDLPGATPGVALLIAKDGKVLYKKGFGYGEIESKTLVTPETKFRIGSITKQFTASAILKLQEQGLLQVTDKLSKYIPDFPRGEEVTIHHLLTHTSGIHSYTNKDDFVTKVISPVTREDLLNYFKKDAYDFNPGDDYRYNNSGYFLLGYIIEKVSGKTFGQFLRETFFDPLQMKNTGVHSSTLKLENEAKGYTKSNKIFEKALNWDMSWAGAAGALYSTVEDLYTWNEAVFNGKVLNEKSLKAAFTPVVLNNGKIPPGSNYGYGWAFGNYRGQDVIQHGGGLHGFLSQLSRFPEENLTVVVLTNVTPPQVNLDANTLAAFYLWEKMDKQPSYSVKSTVLPDLKIFEGRYDFGNGAVMTITSEGLNLFAQLSGQSKFQIFPSSTDEFFWKVVEARIKFIKNEKGEIIHGQFFQGGADITAPKLKDEIIASVDSVIYKDYVGKYDYGNNIIITITTENGRIFAQATGQSKYEILPLEEKEFFIKDLNAKIRFFREPDGRVNKLTVDMAGQKKDAPRVNYK